MCILSIHICRNNSKVKKGVCLMYQRFSCHILCFFFFNISELIRCLMLLLSEWIFSQAIYICTNYITFSINTFSFQILFLWKRSVEVLKLITYCISRSINRSINRSLQYVAASHCNLFSLFFLLTLQVIYHLWILLWLFHLLDPGNFILLFTVHTCNITNYYVRHIIIIILQLQSFWKSNPVHVFILTNSIYITVFNNFQLTTKIHR